MSDFSQPTIQSSIPYLVPHKTLGDPVVPAMPTFTFGEPISYIKLAQAHIAELYPKLYYGDIPHTFIPKGTIVGTWTYSAVGRFRIIVYPDKQLAIGVMPADVARAWVRDEYNIPIKRRKIQMERNYAAPLLARNGVYMGEYAYVDVKKAYPQILRLGWDLEYILGKYIYAEPRPVPQEIYDNKMVYSIAVSMAANGTNELDMIGEYGTFGHRAMNLYSNPCIFNLCQDTLNGIASEALDLFGDKLIYANTDGYIIESAYVDDMIALAASWGLPARIREYKDTNEPIIGSPAIIEGVGSWKVGKFVTERFGGVGQSYQNKFMEANQRHWLKDHLTKWYATLSN